jgi:hypothetical protein
MADPVFILAPGRSFTSVVCAMVGQHPDLYGVPELNLAATDTMHEWWARYGRANRGPAHGLFRTVAELYFGGQSAARVAQGRRWVRRRLGLDTATVWRVLAERVHPLQLVDKSGGTTGDPRRLELLAETFPDARFLHLLRHPRSTCTSMLASPWTRAYIASAGSYDCRTAPPTLDPQVLWCEVHQTIARFLEPLPAERKLRVRGEDLLADPDSHLRSVARWLEVRDDADAIDEMTHPERSPFAAFGPVNAPWGNDPSFLESPELRPYRMNEDTLDGVITWRSDLAGFLPHTKQLAKEFGYA